MKYVLLGDIAKISSGGTPDRKNPEYWNGHIPWVKTGEIQFGTIRDAEEKITERALLETSAKIVPAGSLLMAMYGQGKTRGQVALLGIDAAINQACAAILPHDEDDSRYLFHFLSANYENVRRLSNSGSQENLNAELIRGIRLFYPTKPERQKIADVLGAWHEGLQILDSLISRKGQQKQELAKRLLFGSARISGRTAKWKAHALGDLLETANRYHQWNDNAVYRLAGVRRNGGGLFFRGALRGAEIKVKTNKTIKAGDFLISRRQISYGGMAIVPAEFEDFDVNDEYEVLVIKPNARLDINFLGHLAKTRRFKHAAYLASNGFFAERLRLNFDLDAFLGSQFRFPPSIAEQQRIAAALDTADAELRLLRKQRDALGQQKRGLMQQLLTGRKRVRI